MQKHKQSGNVAGTYGPPKGMMLRRNKGSEPEKPKVNDYLTNAVMTAGKEQLLIMLLDGGLRFIEAGKAGIEAGDMTEAHTNLVRAQDIVTELMASLKTDIGPEIYENLVKLYHFIYERLVKANVETSIEMADEAYNTMKGVREMWSGAIERMNEEGRPDELNPSQIMTHRMDSEA
ncbi:MAG: flagellar export chaperone FliS [Planctomycetota bacterium]